MKTNNTTNFIFLKDFKPELFKLAVNMEEDLLVTPISMFAYATRFLEYILYDIARLNNYEVNRDIGFVKNINELIQLGYLDNYFGDLLIKAYIFRNTSIHNTEITKALKNDKKDAFELNKRLFDIADIYFKEKTHENEEHIYFEPTSQENFVEFEEQINESKNFTEQKTVSESQIYSKNDVKLENNRLIDKIYLDFKIDASLTIKQEKIFDKCIICGKSNKMTESNFCNDCESLLNYRNFLVKIAEEKERGNLLENDSFDHEFMNQLIDDLLNIDVLKSDENRFNINLNGFKDFISLTDKFMVIDQFLIDVINGDVNPYKSHLYSCTEYPYRQISQIVIEHHISELIKLLENGYSQKNALNHVDINQSILNNWYMDKKSEFIKGYKDSLFIRYNELLIDISIKLILQNKSLGSNRYKIDFWKDSFAEYLDKISQNLTGDQLENFQEVFKINDSKKVQLKAGNNQSNVPQDSNIDKVEIEKRKKLMLKYIEDFNFKVALKKSKLSLSEVIKDKKECINHKRKNFYYNLSQKLMNQYIILRMKEKSTHEICKILGINESEVKMWENNEIFKEFQFRYNKVRLKLLEKAIKNNKTHKEILIELELNDNQLSELIELVNDDVNYIEFRKIVEEFSSKINIDLL